MSLAKIFIIVLYSLSGLLPVIGFTRSYCKHRDRLAMEQQRKQRIETIDFVYELRNAAATTELQRQEAEVWRNEQNNEKDPTGRPYGVRGGILFADDSVPRAAEQYEQLKFDMGLVGLAVIFGATASIWSILL